MSAAGTYSGQHHSLWVAAKTLLQQPTTPASTTAVDWPLSISLVFCCCQQVYDIVFNMSCVGVILHVRGLDGISTPQNGAAAYSVLRYHIFARVVSRCVPRGFRLPECPSPMVGPPSLQRFPLTSLSLASSQLLMQTLHVWLARHYRVTRTQSQHLGRFVI